MSRKYFGTDGVRGTVGTFPIVPDFVVRLGYAAGKVLAKHPRMSTHGADRKGHPDFGLHAGSLSAGRLFECRC